MRALPLALCTVTLAATAAVSGTANAGCNTFVDPSGDARGSTVFDIRGGDLVVGKKTVVGTLKLTSTSVGSDPFAKLGGEWNLLFSVGSTKYELWRALSHDGKATSGMTVGGKAVKIAAPKVSGNSITWTVPRSAVKSSKPVCGAYGWTYNVGIGVDHGGA